MSMYARKCPRCNQFMAVGKAHNCPLDDDTPPTTVSGIKWTENQDGAVLEVKAKRIKTLSDLLKAAKVDLAKWYVERHVINKWEVGAKNTDGEIEVEPLFQVKVWLKPLMPIADVSEIIKEQVDDMIRHSPEPKIIYGTPEVGRNKRYIHEINVSDLHFGMYAWREEAGSNYDLKIAKQLFMDSVMKLAQRAVVFPVERIVLPIGNDLLHVDYPIAGKGGTTAKGTPQDVDTRYKKMFREARIMLVEAIEFLKLIAPVYVVVVPGNHDKERIFCLGDSLEAWYHNDNRVDVDNEATSRKYVMWGHTLIGYTHGSEEKLSNLPQIMADEEKIAWGSSTWREWHIGHTHAKQEKLSEVGGVRIITVPSIAPNDEWHTRKGYHHVRAAESYLYEFDEGFAGSFSVYATGESLG